jgi:hypothetical protein
MGTAIRWVADTIDRIFDVAAIKKRMLHIHPRVNDTGPFNGSRKVASFTLGTGQWLVIAKASARGYGGNEGLADCRLMIVGTEGDVSASDESYGSPAPLLYTTMTVLLPFKVADAAQFVLYADVQTQQAEFLKIVATAVRDSSTVE